MLHSVFARHGVYRSPQVFVDGFTQAVWVAVGLSATGIVAALLTAARRRRVAVPAAPEVALAEAA